jgi:hypothetical protein
MNFLIGLKLGMTNMNWARHWVATALFAGILGGISTNATAWSMVADFEDGVVGQKAQGASAFSEGFSASKIVSDVVYDGGKAAILGITAGSDGWGEWGGRFVFPVKLYEGSEAWMRGSLYFPTTFNYTASPRLKFFRFHTAEGHIDLYILPNGKLDYDNEVTHYTTANNSSLYFGSIVKGTWQTYEVYVKFSSVPGQGIYRVWQNGKLVYEDKTQKTLQTTSSFSDFSYVFTYWNGNAPQTQSLYLDDVIITSDRPGCQDDHGNYFIGPAKSSAPACNKAQ